LIKLLLKKVVKVIKVIKVKYFIFANGLTQ